MKKFHVDGFLESFDFESFDACGTYLKDDGNSVHRPKIERATYLMEIMHVDVYGPLYVVVRGGFFYFMKFRR